MHVPCPLTQFQFARRRIPLFAAAPAASGLILAGSGWRGPRRLWGGWGMVGEEPQAIEGSQRIKECNALDRFTHIIGLWWHESTTGSEGPWLVVVACFPTDVRRSDLPLLRPHLRMHACAFTTFDLHGSRLQRVSCTGGTTESAAESAALVQASGSSPAAKSSMYGTCRCSRFSFPAGSSASLREYRRSAPPASL